MAQAPPAMMNAALMFSPVLTDPPCRANKAGLLLSSQANFPLLYSSYLLVFLLREVQHAEDADPPIKIEHEDAFDPFSPTRSLSQVLNLMDQLMDDPFSRGLGAGLRRGWDVREEDDALYLRIDMPGLGKEDVHILVDQNTLTIRAEGDRESDDEGSGRRYSSRIDLPPNLYNVYEIKAEMKNGVLRVSVPKVKEEERKDVFQVQVQ